MRTVLAVLWLPFVVVMLIFVWLSIDTYTGWLGPRLPQLGFTLLVLGTVLALWCALLFVVTGRGSPHPFIAKTKRLVRIGPYEMVRNPMMWGIGAVLTGLALMLGSVGLWFGFALFVAFVLWFVPGYEEPDLLLRFGQDYKDYCSEVPRWFPRLTHHHVPHGTSPLPR